MEDEKVQPEDETPEEWAHRVTGKLRGLLKDEIQAFGGTDGYMRWVGPITTSPEEMEPQAGEDARRG